MYEGNHRIIATITKALIYSLRLSQCYDLDVCPHPYNTCYILHNRNRYGRQDYVRTYEPVQLVDNLEN